MATIALRSVGDKIDKLEDNVDDGLSDIVHSLDKVSGAPGGSATQLHLSGGTISSGPTSGQPQQNAQTETATGEGQTPHQQHQPQQSPTHPSREDGAVDASADGDAASQPDSTESPPEPAPTGVVDNDSAADGAETEPPTNGKLESDAETVHPRAQHNPGGSSPHPTEPRGTRRPSSTMPSGRPSRRSRVN